MEQPRKQAPADEKLQAWRNAKIAEWEARGRLFEKFPTRDLLEAWMDRQYQKARALQQSTMSQPAEFKIPELSAQSRTFLKNIAGFLKCRQAVDATALAYLPRKWMERHESFVNKERMKQKNMAGALTRYVDEVFKVASLAQPIFNKILRQIVVKSKLDPDQKVMLNGKPLMLDHDTQFKVLSLAPLKGRARCIEKVEKEYGGDYFQLLDVVRCSIVVFTEEQLEDVAQALNPAEPHVGYIVVRLKNRFKYPLFNGYRDALYSISLNCGNGIWHVCEVQLHLAAVVAHKEESHVYYEYFRTYFSGSGAEEKRMDALVKIGSAKIGNDVDRMITSILEGQDLNQLDALSDLLVLMGEVQVAAMVSKRMMDLQPDSLYAKHYHAKALRSQGKLSEAESLCRETLTRSRQQLGDVHPETLVAMKNLSVSLQSQGKLAEAEELERQQQQQGHVDAGNFGLLLKAQGRFEEAEPLLRKELAAKRQQLGDGDEGTLAAMNNLAAVLQSQHKPVEAGPLFREALTGTRKQLGDLHLETLGYVSNLGASLQSQGKLEEAEPLFREALTGTKQQLGNMHPDTLMCLNNLALLLQSQGKLSQAEALFREALAGKRQLLGSMNPEILRSLINLAMVLKKQRELTESESLLREALTVSRTAENRKTDTLFILSNYAEVLRDQDKLAEAEPFYRESLTECKQHFGNVHPKTLNCLNELAAMLVAQRKLQEAEIFFREAVIGSKQHFGDDHSKTRMYSSNLEKVLKAQGK